MFKSIYILLHIFRNQLITSFIRYVIKYWNIISTICIYFIFNSNNKEKEPRISMLQKTFNLTYNKFKRRKTEKISSKSETYDCTISR